MEPQRYLRCLGQPALFAPTGEPIRFRTRKHLALLVYIAIEARSHRRDRLSELLWPRVSASEARHSLATALSILRPRLGLDALETSRDQVRLMPGRVALDLDRLQAGDVLGTEVSGPLEVAAFLDGFDITDSTEFTHWKDRQQARLLPVIKDALLVLIDRCRRTGNTRQIEQVADRMLALDELSEEAIRAKMEARAFAGDRLTALEIFEAWKKKLAEELQAVPSDLVEGMAVRLRRRGWERTTLANIPNVPTDQWRGRPFIGRTAEYQVLYERWEAARKGMPGHVMVLGDSGVGKTTLVQRLTTAAGLEGAAISRVQCYDLEREIPYSTLSGLVLGLLDRPGVSATSPEALAELSRIVPEVRQRFPNTPVPSESQGETARIRVTEAFLEMLTAIADEHPVILVIDDLHLADDVSLAVLHLVIRRARGKPVEVVLVARPGELAQSPQAVSLRESAVSIGIRQIELSPLSNDESAALLQSLIAPDDPQPGIVDRRSLIQAAAGYPMVLELLVQDWKVSREASLALSIDAMTAELGDEGSTQFAYKQLLDRITRSLDTTTHNVLNLAAILGPRLNDVSMYGIADLSAGQTMTGMADLVNRRVLRDGPQGLEFVNELVRAAVYLGIPPTIRRALHSHIADRLVHQGASNHKDFELELAWHCMRGGRIPEGTNYLLSGARNSVKYGALYSAERALSSALPNLRGQERSDAALLLVEVMQEQGRWQDSLEVLFNSGIEHSHSAMLVYSLIPQHWTHTTPADDICEYLDRLQSVIESSAETRLRIKAAKISASLSSTLRDPDRAKSIFASISSIPMPAAPDDMARLIDSKAQVLYYAYERASCLQEILLVAEQLADQDMVNSTMASLHTGLGVLACGEGKYEEAKAELLYAYGISSRLGNDSEANSRAAQISLCCYRLGEYAEGLEWVRLATKSLTQTTFGGYLECQIARHGSCCHALLGNRDMALNTISNLDSKLTASIPPWLSQAWGLHKADTLLYLGLTHEALAAANMALGRPRPTLHDRSFAGAFARWVAFTSKEAHSEDVGRLQLDRMMWDLEKFDALDQVEVLCAYVLLGCGSTSESQCLGWNIRERLQRLPSAITNQLGMLGVLPATKPYVSRLLSWTN